MAFMREIEVKIEVPSADEARRRLGGAGAEAMAPRVFEDNRVYDDAEGSLERSQQLLRLRTTGGRHTLTFKRPDATEPEESRYKVRVEQEVQVDDADTMHRLLTELGYRVAYRYQKYRQSYMRGALRIDLDETPIGVFVELEGLPESIDRLAQELGFAGSSYINRTYRQLQVEKSGGQDPGDLVFAERVR
jgi:adenylate cyclase class 2